MPIQFWMVRVDRPLTGREQDVLRTLLPREREEKLRRQPPEKQAEVLCAYGLLLALLWERECWKSLHAIRREAGGKPVFPAHPEICFSISHTAGAAAAAVSETPVGVDIQCVRTPPPHLAQRTGEETPENFSRRWVRWESIAKRRGTGLLDLVRGEPSLAPEEVYTAVAAFPGYAAGVAGTEPVCPEQVRRLTAEDLLGCLDI